MTKNPILEELYAVREKMLEEHGGDLVALMRALADKYSDHPVANITPRKIVRKTTSPLDATPEQSSSPPIQR
jgi:hypothetical protein